MIDIQSVYNAATDVCETYTGEHDDGVIDCLVGCFQSAMNEFDNNYTYACNLLEKASTYVQVDMNEDELEEFVDFCMYKIEEYTSVM